MKPVRIGGFKSMPVQAVSSSDIDDVWSDPGLSLMVGLIKRE